jgi:hypothetical protein
MNLIYTHNESGNQPPRNLKPKKESKNGVKRRPTLESWSGAILYTKKVGPAPSTRCKYYFILVAILHRQAFAPLFVVFFLLKRKEKIKKAEKKKEPEPQWKHGQKGSGSGS